MDRCHGPRGSAHDQPRLIQEIPTRRWITWLSVVCLSRPHVEAADLPPWCEGYTGSYRKISKMKRNDRDKTSGLNDEWQLKMKRWDGSVVLFEPQDAKMYVRLSVTYKDRNSKTDKETHTQVILLIASIYQVWYSTSRATGRLNILILVNLEINRKKQTMYINYQPQHTCHFTQQKNNHISNGLCSYYRSSQLFRHTSSLTLAGERAAQVLLTISP